MIILILIIVIILYYESSNMTNGSMGFSAAIVAFAQAIAYSEGFYTPGTVPYRANNPGDLTKGDIGDTGQYITASGGIVIIVFPDADSGWNALYTKLQRIADGISSVYDSDMSLSDFASEYSGDKTGSYLNSLISKIGYDANTSIGDILNA